MPYRLPVPPSDRDITPDTWRTPRPTLPAAAARPAQAGLARDLLAFRLVSVFRRKRSFRGWLAKLFEQNDPAP